MTPLGAILSWWETLDEFPRQHIAANVCLRLMPRASARDEQLFRGFLMEELPANWHIGRVLAVRAVIDFWFLCDQQSRASTMLLDAVEEADVELKSLANAALGRMPQVRKATDTALDTWRHLREGAISDAALVSAERDAMIRRALG